MQQEKPSSEEKKTRRTRSSASLLRSDAVQSGQRFSWGNSNQGSGWRKGGFEAIHLHSGTAGTNGELVRSGPEATDKGRYGTVRERTILWSSGATRKAFDPTCKPCPSFGRYLRLAEEAGSRDSRQARILGYRGTGRHVFDKLLPIEWPKGH
jgi:hypothetical protein